MKAKVLVLLELMLLLAGCDLSFLFGTLSNGSYTRETADITETFVLSDDGFTLTRKLKSNNSTLREYSGTFLNSEDGDDNITLYYLSDFDSSTNTVTLDTTKPQLKLTYNSPTLVVQIDVNADGEFIENDNSGDVYVSLE